MRTVRRLKQRVHFKFVSERLLNSNKITLNATRDIFNRGGVLGSACMWKEAQSVIGGGRDQLALQPEDSCVLASPHKNDGQDRGAYHVVKSPDIFSMDLFLIDCRIKVLHERRRSTTHFGNKQTDPYSSYRNSSHHRAHERKARPEFELGSSRVCPFCSPLLSSF